MPLKTTPFYLSQVAKPDIYQGDGGDANKNDFQRFEHKRGLTSVVHYWLATTRAEVRTCWN
jgi:hypothetical protein